jgi:hypothetical protein
MSNSTSADDVPLVKKTPLSDEESAQIVVASDDDAELAELTEGRMTRAPSSEARLVDDHQLPAADHIGYHGPPLAGWQLDAVHAWEWSDARACSCRADVAPSALQLRALSAA